MPRSRWLVLLPVVLLGLLVLGILLSRFSLEKASSKTSPSIPQRPEFITPYTPEQHGMIERFFRSLKEECTWQKNFSSFLDAKIEVNRWIEFYNQPRPHQSLGYLSPVEFRQKQCQLVA